MRPPRRRLPVLLALLVGYVLLMSFGGCADKLILYPSTQPIDPGRAQRHMLHFNQRQIEVFTASSPAVSATQPAQAMVLEFTGNATRAEEVAEYVADRFGARAVEVWVMNYPGYGRSTGPAKLDAIPKSALATYDELAKLAGGRPIFVAGNSLGTTAALHVATRRNVAGLILQSPPPLQRIILKRHGWWNLWLVAAPVAMSVPSELNALETAKKSRAPALFILSGADSIVPIEYQRAVEGAYAGPKRILLRAESDHNDPIDAQDEKALQEGLDWLWNQVVREPAPGAG